MAYYLDSEASVIAYYITAVSLPSEPPSVADRSSAVYSHHSNLERLTSPTGLFGSVAAAQGGCLAHVPLWVYAEHGTTPHFRLRPHTETDAALVHIACLN